MRVCARTKHPTFIANSNPPIVSLPLGATFGRWACSFSPSGYFAPTFQRLLALTCPYDKNRPRPTDDRGRLRPILLPLLLAEVAPVGRLGNGRLQPLCFQRRKRPLLEGNRLLVKDYLLAVPLGRAILTSLRQRGHSTPMLRPFLGLFSMAKVIASSSRYQPLRQKGHVTFMFMLVKSSE